MMTRSEVIGPEVLQDMCDAIAGRPAEAGISVA